MDGKSKFNRKQLVVAVGAACAAMAAPAWAQDTGEKQIEEIFVTATRRATSVTDIPYNISAMSGDDLDALQAVNQNDVLRAMYGITVIDRGYRNAGMVNSIVIRGLNVDNGANADCKPEWLLQFAIMGSLFVEKMDGIARPRVALISNGEEEGKGNQLVKETIPLLRDMLHSGDDRIVLRDADGDIRFNAEFRNAGDVRATLEGRSITRVGVKWAWEHGMVDLAGWRLCAPFAANPGGEEEGEKKDAVSPCAA